MEDKEMRPVLGLTILQVTVQAIRSEAHLSSRTCHMDKGIPMLILTWVGACSNLHNPNPSTRIPNNNSDSRHHDSFRQNLQQVLLHPEHLSAPPLDSRLRRCLRHSNNHKWEA